MTAAVLDRPGRVRGSAAPVLDPSRLRAFRPPRPALRVVPDRRTRRRRRTMATLAASVVVTLLTVVGFHVVLAQHQLALEQLGDRTSATERRYQEARLEHATLSSPRRIVERAVQLGLVAPAAPPTAIPVAGAPPPEPDAPSSTLNGWTDVKPTLGEVP